MDTIYALASAPGRAGVAVVRVSGPRAWESCLHLAGDLPPARMASLRSLRDGEDLIDEALVLRFDQGESFTGEASVEYQCHGSPAVVARLMRTLSKLEGFRAAEAGEFTRRALENDRMDLAQVEGLADLIDAETEAQRRQALRIFEGELGRKVEFWRHRLLRAAALIEASIDFADEDVPEDVFPEVAEIIGEIISRFREEIAGVAVAEQVRNGFEVAIVGPPNAGKSTLLNKLAGRDAAITSEFAGTTRDVIEVRMDVSGIPVTFLDTAGMRETSDVIESIGVERARMRAEAADLRIFIGGGELGIAHRSGDILVSGKSDLGLQGEGLPVSGKTGAGLGALLARVESVLSERMSSTQTAIRLRHAEALRSACESLAQARIALEFREQMAEILAEHIRIAIRAVEMLVGRIGVEDVLEEIFSSFCIGK